MGVRQRLRELQSPNLHFRLSDGSFGEADACLRQADSPLGMLIHAPFLPPCECLWLTLYEIRGSYTWAEDLRTNSLSTEMDDYVAVQTQRGKMWRKH